MTVLWGGLLLSVTQSLTVSKSPGVKGWLGTCWELSFILPVAPEGVCQGSASNGWILVEVLIN